MQRPTILNTRIVAPVFSIMLRPFGDDDLPTDDGPEAPWGELEAQIGREPAKEPDAKPDDKPEGSEIVPKPDDQPDDDAAKEAAAKKAADDAEAAKKDEEDPELKKFQPHPSASPEVVTNHKALKQVAKTFKTERDAAKTELETVRKELTEIKEKGIADPAKEEELTKLREENEKLRKTAMVVELEESPEFKEKYHQPLETARTGLKALLVRLNMPEKLADEAVAKGEGWTRWPEAMGHIKNELDKEEVLEARRAIRKAVQAREQAVADLKGPEREKLLAERQSRDKESTTKFWQGTGQEAQKLLDTEGQHMQLEKIPDAATPEQKTAIEARNKVIKERNGEVSNLIKAAYVEKDPAALAKLAFNAANSLFLKEELTETKAKMADLQKRLSEAEAKIGKANKLGGDKSRPPVNPKKITAPGEDSEMSPDDAMDAARREYHAQKA